MKGGDAPLAARFIGPSSANLTSKCDYPPMESLVDPHKGSSFALEPRFKYPVEAAPVPSDNESLSTIERPAHKPGILFDKAERFGDKDAKPSVLLRIPVRADSSTVGTAMSSLAADDTINSAEWGQSGKTEHTNNTNTTSASGTKNTNSTYTSAQKPVSRSEEGYFFEVSDEDLYSKDDAELRSQAPSDLHSHSEQSVAQGQEQEQQYVDYEYFPSDKPGPGHYDVSVLSI